MLGIDVSFDVRLGLLSQYIFFFINEDENPARCNPALCVIGQYRGRSVLSSFNGVDGFFGSGIFSFQIKYSSCSSI